MGVLTILEFGTCS